jgi:hypothetical protein
MFRGKSKRDVTVLTNDGVSISILRDHLIDACSLFRNPPARMDADYVCKFCVPQPVFEAFCDRINGKPIHPPFRAEFQVWFRGLAQELGFQELLSELTCIEIKEQLDLICPESLDAEIETASEVLDSLFQGDFLIARCRMLCDKLADLPAAILELQKASLIQVLAGIGSGNPHLTGMLTVKASSGCRPYVVADLRLQSFWTSDNVEGQWIAYGFKRKVIVNKFKLEVPAGAHLPNACVLEGAVELGHDWASSDWEPLAEGASTALIPGKELVVDITGCQKPYQLIRIRHASKEIKKGWEHVLCFTAFDIWGFFVE